MAEVEIPDGTQASSDMLESHGPGYDGLRTGNGHAPKADQKPVTIAIVGAGQRGSVSLDPQSPMTQLFVAPHRNDLARWLAYQI